MKNTYLFVLSRIRIRDHTWIQISIVNLRSGCYVRFIPRGFLSVRRILFCSRWILDHAIAWWRHWANLVSRGDCDVAEVAWWSVCARAWSFISRICCPLGFSSCTSKTIWFYRIKLTYIMRSYTWVTNLFVISRSRSRIKSISWGFQLWIFAPFRRFCTNHFTRKILSIAWQGLLILISSRCWYTPFNSSHFIIVVIYFIL